MTIKASGSLSMSEINAEFGLGNNLNAYRGVQWWLDNGSSGNFPNTGVSFNDFYNKRKIAPKITLTFPETTYTAGFTTSGTIPINLATVMASQGITVQSGDFFQIGSQHFQGSWCGGWLPRQVWYIRYGTAYNSPIINGNLVNNKNHVIQGQYPGGTTFTVRHYYTFQNNTDFPNARVAIVRLIWKAASTPGQSFSTFQVALSEFPE